MTEAHGGENPQPKLTLRELIFKNNNSLTPLGITLLKVAVNWKLKHSFLKILPKFSDMPEEDPQGRPQDIYVQPEYLHQGLDLGKEELPAQVYVQPIDQSNVLPKEVTISDADEILLKDTDEAQGDAEEGTKDKVDDLVQEEAELLKAEEQPSCMEIVDFEDNTKLMAEEILPQDPLGQEITRAQQRNLDLTKKLLALVIIRLNSAYPRERPMRIVPKKSDKKVVEKKWKKLLPMELHGNWGISKGHQNFIWDPGQGESDVRLQ